MGYYESPHTNYYDKDLHQVIELYDHLTATYDSLLHDIRGLGFRLDDYIRQTDAKIPGAVDRAIKRYVQQLEVYKRDAENYYQNMVRLVESYNDSNRKKFKELEKELAGWHKHLDAHNKALYRVVSQLQQELGTAQREWAERFKEFTELVDFRMDAWRIFARGLDAENREWTEGLIDDLARRVDEIVSNDSTMVYNPYRVDYTSLQLFIDDLWGYVLPVPWGYTADEWDRDTEITCEYWDKALDLTCITWYIKGKLIFRWDARRRRINSWVSGRLVTPEEGLKELYPLIYELLGAISAGAYDGWEHTAEAYENLKISAERYDNGNARQELWKGGI